MNRILRSLVLLSAGVASAWSQSFPCQIANTSPLPDAYVGQTDYSVPLTLGPGCTIQTPGSYNWGVVSGSLPPGLRLNATTTESRSGGVIEDNSFGDPDRPTTPGTYTFSVTAFNTPQSSGAKEFQITVHPQIITTNSLPPATRGAAYSATLTHTGTSTAGYTWALLSDTLPQGLTFDTTTGVISGTPTEVTANAPGIYPLTFRVSDAFGRPSPNKQLNLVLNEQPIQILTNATLPRGAVNRSYSTTLTATGGYPPYFWFIAQGFGTGLPNGLSFTSDGTIAGTINDTAGTYTFRAIAASMEPGVAFQSRDFTLIVNPQLTITTTSLPFGVNGAAYGPVPLQASGGQGSFSWSVPPSSLPPGLSLTSGGSIVGTPTTTGTFNFNATVVDSAASPNANQTATRALSITIADPLTITTVSPLPSGTFGVPYDTAIVPAGGTPSYTWSLASGTLPANVILNASTGHIAGTPGNAGTFNFTVQVRDSATPTQQVVSKAFALIINSGLDITNASPLPAATVGTTYTVNFTATGGDGAMTWSVASGALPPALTLNPSTGVLTGIPTTDGTYVFMLEVLNPSTEQRASKAFTVTVANPTLTISSTSPLPAGTLGTSYNTVLGTSGGEAPFTWSLTAGALPGGITLNPSTGQLSGTPTAGGPFNFTVQVQDSSESRQTAARAFALTINPAAVIITTATPLTGGRVGEAYSQPLLATGGVTPYTWAIESGALPGGVALNPTTGVLSGTPTASGTFTFTARVTDSQTPTAQSVARQFTIVIVPPILVISTVSPLPNGTVGTPQAITFVATGGTSPYTWSLAAAPGNNIPPGMTFSPSGVLSGTPTAHGTYSFTVIATDAGDPSQTTQRAFLIDIAPAALTFSILELPIATINQPYSYQIPISGGVPPYTCVIKSGALPQGITLSPTCLLSGIPTQIGAFTFTVRVTDVRGVSSLSDAGGPVVAQAAGAFAENTFTLVVDAGFPVITTVLLPSATALTPYSTSLSSIGGVAPYSYALQSGSLPAGLVLTTSGQIIGTAASEASTSFTVLVNDSRGNAGAKSFTLTVSPRETQTDRVLEVATANMPEGTVGKVYGLVFAARNGVEPYSWSIGGLPSGFEANSLGEVIGTPTQAGSFPVQASVRDANGKQAVANFTFVVKPGVITITTDRVGNGRVDEPFSASFAAIGGVPPYQFGILAGSLPPGLSLSSAGALTGTPTVTGTFGFTVSATDTTNARGEKAFTMVIQPARLQITNTSLGNGAVGVPYAAAVGATGGTPPYAFTASGLPDGVSIDATTGGISGTPTRPGSFSANVTVTDKDNQTASRTFTVEITSAIVITTNAIGNMTTGTPVNVGLSASGGQPPYSWSLANGSLPGGLGIGADGIISGTPNAAGTFSFSVQVTDQNNTTATKGFTLTVTTRLEITTTTLGVGTVAVPYSASLSATGGTEPHSWGVAGGSLPPGLSLSATGSISGTPTESGTFSFTARVTDGATPSQTADRGFTIQIGLPALSGVTIVLPQNPQPQQQGSVGLLIPAPFPVDVSGAMTLTFQPNAVNQADDPAIQFSTGGRSIAFTIPAGQTQAVFRVPNLAIQTGTTAGTITLVSTLTAGGGAVNCPNCQLGQSVSIPRMAPVITNVRVTRTSTGFTVTLTGFSTTRDILQGTFRFAGSNLQTTELVVPLTATFNTWFQSEPSQQFGGQFTMTLPFTIQGDTSSVTSLTVTLTNAVGASQPSTANF